MINLLDLSKNEISEMAETAGFPRYRAAQIFSWLYRGIDDISRMSDLPMEMRMSLSKKYEIAIPQIASELISKTDRTRKYLLKLKDGNIVESVLMKYRYGHSVCISSQVGCRMGCSFCASTGAGFIRDLTAGEMMGQVLAVQTKSGEKAGNIVIMGIGEPFDNYANTLKFLKNANDPAGLNLGYRKLTLSTCGLVPEIMKFAGEGIPVNLSISLHASDNRKRSSLMPVNRRYSIDKIISACKIYTEMTRRRITFEYAMIGETNDSREDALGLASLLKGMLCHVNIIPVNPVEGKGFRKSGADRLEMFREVLQKAGITVTVRRELGEDISAACGQLRRKT